MSLEEVFGELVEEHYLDEDRGRLSVEESPDEVAARVRAVFDFRGRRRPEDLLEKTWTLLRELGEHSSPPTYFGLFRPRIERSVVMAEALVALEDPNLAVRRFGPAAAEIERHTLRTVARHFGEEIAEGTAHFTSGGQAANHTAVIVALTDRVPRFAEDGVSGGGPLTMYVSEEAHHSFVKVAHACGLGRSSLRRIPCDESLRLDLLALRSAVAEDRARGLRPFLVAGTAGTTSAGAIDPLPELATFAREEELWFHVDAAWAGAAALSPKLAPHLRGIELADSITCDAHKWLSVPVGAGMFFCRHREAVVRAFEVEPQYAPTPRGDFAGYSTSLEWSRRLRGLGLAFRLAEHGLEGIAAELEAMTDMGEVLQTKLEEAGYQILPRSPFPLVCFTHSRLRADRKRHAALARRVQERGRAWLSATLLPRAVPALRACITNTRTRVEHVEILVDEVDAALAELRSGAG